MSKNSWSFRLVLGRNFKIDDPTSLILGVANSTPLNY